MGRVIAIEEPLGRLDGLLTLGWWCLEDVTVDAAEKRGADLDAAEKYLVRAIDLVKAGKVAPGDRPYRAYLYAARMLVLLRGPPDQVRQFAENAAKIGWAGDADERRWALEGGPTPGAMRGTRGFPTYGPPR
jgi:hypothetical protein